MEQNTTEWRNIEMRNSRRIPPLLRSKKEMVITVERKL